MKKLFSVLMVAVVATLAFAFTPKASLLDVTYHLDGTEWVEGEGENCGGNLALCEVTFNENFADYYDLIGAEVEAATAQFPTQVTINIPGQGATPVDVIVTRKLQP